MSTYDPTYQREYRRTHREQCNASARQYARRNKEARAAYSRKYREEHPADPAQAAKNAKAYRQRHPERHRATSRRQTLKKYGLTPEAYADMLAAQSGCCAVCVGPLRPGRGTHIDHDHKTGAVRGLLCNSCNSILGHAHDNPVILELAIKYLTPTAS